MTSTFEKFRELLEGLANSGRMEIVAQGHKGTGRLIASIQPEASMNGDTMRGDIWVEEHGLILDAGVKADRVPFSGTAGPGLASGQQSAYIEGLLDFIETIKPGLDDQEKLGFAFAIAHTHAEEGISSLGSYSFSENGRRTGWIKWGLEDHVPEMIEELDLFAILEGHLVENIERNIGRKLAA